MPMSHAEAGRLGGLARKGGGAFGRGKPLKKIAPGYGKPIKKVAGSAYSRLVLKGKKPLNVANKRARANAKRLGMPTVKKLTPKQRRDKRNFKRRMDYQNFKQDMYIKPLNVE